MKNVHLNTCPFCGGTAELYQYSENTYRIKCTACQASTFEITEDPEQTGVSWNRRYDKDAVLTEQIENFKQLAHNQSAATDDIKSYDDTATAEAISNIYDQLNENTKESTD